MRDVLLMAIIFGALPFCVLRPQFGILMYVWIGLMNPHRFVYQLSRFPVALTVGAATVVGMIVMRRMGRIPMRSETGLILAWFCYTTLTTIVALAPGAWNEWDRFGKILLMTIVAGLILQSRKGLTQFVFTIMMSIAVFGLKGGVFSILTGGNYRVWGPEDSFIAGNNELALAELMILPFVIYFIRQEKVLWRRLALQDTFVLTAISIIFSYSRGALVAFVGLALTLVWRTRHRARALLIAVVGTALILAFVPTQWTERMVTIEQYEKDPSALGRINAWYFAWNLATSRFIGGGFQAFTPQLFLQYAPEPQNYHDAHSIYFEVLGEQGFPGLAIFLGLMGASWFRMQRLRKRTKLQGEWKWVRDMAEMIQCSIVAYALAGAFLGLAYFDLYYYIVMAGVLLDVVYVEELRAREGLPMAATPGLRNLPAPAIAVSSPRTS